MIAAIKAINVIPPIDILHGNCNVISLSSIVTTTAAAAATATCVNGDADDSIKADDPVDGVDVIFQLVLLVMLLIR
jgi:hypothetical protein